ncbi:MAG TPA: sugar kinase [Roseiflexaceae bacterium]|nr:sugar kinase [Roseiflexaceae bacterium]
MPEVVTLGECMGVFYPPDPVTLDDARTLLWDIGGAEANMSIALARLGHTARFISRVGDDPFGRRVRAVLEAEGVDTAALVTDPSAPTGVFFREWLPDMARRVYYYRAGSAASRLAPEHLAPELFAGARVVHLTGITPALSTSCAAACLRAVELAKAGGALVSLDPNYRPRLWGPEAFRAALLPLLRQTDILLMGHEDARAALGVEDEDDMLAAGAALGARVVVLKRAERGALALAEGRRYEVPAEPVARAIDPVGAGDGFDAGFLAGWLRGWDTAAALHLGAKVGAASVQALGDYAGYPREGNR